MWKVDRWWIPSDGKSSHGLWPVELTTSKGRHFAPLGHIILIPNQPVFALTI
jgi:hypothetical protein